ncbi:MgtC/SapB family protein [Ottowia caeni]|uniref:MgtC/SapB family protein n=1 Tax=Ottowia caeni TaxID=2870339 RepID=UPI003D722903
MAAEILDSNWLDAGARLAAALGCGLLVGTERERRKGQGPDRALAGIRSFTLASVLGCACMLAGGFCWLPWAQRWSPALMWRRIGEAVRATRA